MNTERMDRMRTAMEMQGLDVLVCRLPENVLMLSGYWPLCGWVFFLFPLEGKPICILPDTEKQEAAAELWDSECSIYPFGTIGAGNQFEHIGNALREAAGSRDWKRVGYEGNFESIAPAWNAAELYIPARRTYAHIAEVFGEDNLVDATELICVQRACKTPYEIQKLQVVNDISCIGLETFMNTVRPGKTGVELSAAVESSVMTGGTGYHEARRVRAFAQVAVGTAETSIAYRPMEISTMRRLESGDIALLELAVVADGFWSDRTRACVAGVPTAQHVEINDILKIAQNEAIEAVKSGSTGGDVDRAARRIVEDAGHVKHFVHITGHGVGFGYHESLPLIAPESRDVLQAGMVHSVEPGIYFPELGGIRIEDDVLVTENGREVLGQFGRDLEQ